MTTQDKSREAFEARFKSSFDLGLNNSGAYKNEATYSAFVVFKYAEAYGRKVALEEAVDLANNWAMAHVIEDNAKLTVGDYIAKELIK
jgi:hypothetical protein